MFVDDVFSGVEEAKGLMYGELYLYEHFCDATRGVTDSLFQAMTALAKNSDMPEPSRPNWLNLTISFEGHKMASISLIIFTLRRGYQLSICMILGQVSYLNHLLESTIEVLFHFTVAKRSVVNPSLGSFYQFSTFLSQSNLSFGNIKSKLPMLTLGLRSCSDAISFRKKYLILRPKGGRARPSFRLEAYSTHPQHVAYRRSCLKY